MAKVSSNDLEAYRLDSCGGRAAARGQSIAAQALSLVPASTVGHELYSRMLPSFGAYGDTMRAFSAPGP